MSKTKNTKKDPSRLNRVGGQAVLEGVMMKAGNRVVTSCRKENGDISVIDDSYVSLRKRKKIFNIPLLRGVINFFEMMALSVKTLNNSAEALGIEDEESKFEKWLKKHFGLGIMHVVMAISVVLGLALSLFLFLFLPSWIANGINSLFINFAGFSIHETVIAVIEGVLKVTIFLSYLSLTTLVPDIKRTFMYHGAEHKSIACFEAGMEFTPENAAKCTRFHPRCGTSYMFLMILLGIFAGMFVRNIFPGLNAWAYTGIRLLILPIVMGIGYEILMFAGKHDNLFTKIVSTPGLWVQRITTKEPTLDMLEVAITSIKCALRDDFPEFREFWESKGWEKADKSNNPDEESNENGDIENVCDSDKANLKINTECCNSSVKNINSDIKNCDLKAISHDTNACKDAEFCEEHKNIEESNSQVKNIRHDFALPIIDVEKNVGTDDSDNADNACKADDSESACKVHDSDNACKVDDSDNTCKTNKDGSSSSFNYQKEELLTPPCPVKNDFS